MRQVAHAIIMAGGSGKRMGYDVPKQLLDVGNMPMVVHLLYLCDQLGIDAVLVLSKTNKDVVLNVLTARNFITQDKSDPLTYAYRSIRVWIAVQDQSVSNGTGGAIKAARDVFLKYASYHFMYTENIIVLSADVPLVSQQTIRSMLDLIDVAEGTRAVVCCKGVSDPHGYGRIMTDKDGRLTDIVEQRDIDKFSIQDADKCKLINEGVWIPLMHFNYLAENKF